MIQVERVAVSHGLRTGLDIPRRIETDFFVILVRIYPNYHLRETARLGRAKEYAFPFVHIKGIK